MTIERVNERELLSAAMQGSQIVYREPLHLHMSAVSRFAWALAGEEDAQTVTENAFITTWRQLPYLNSMNVSFRERLLQLVCIDSAELARRQHRRRSPMPPAQNEDALNFPFGPLRYDPRTNMEHLALQTDIEEAIRALPFRFRRILLLHEMGDLADTQIADITDSTAEAVHSDLQRAQGFVRRQIILGGGFFPAAGARDKDSAPKYRACKTYLPVLSAAADDLCTNSEKQMLLAHLAQCPGCQGYYEALRAIHHGIAVMKCEVPGDMETYIMRRIQQENGGEDAPAKKRRAFRPAFGRFTVIALCIALVLLAYSNGILGRFSLPGGTQNDPTPGQETVTPDDPDSTPEEDEPPAEEDPAPPEEEDGETDPENPDAQTPPEEGQEEGQGGEGGAIVPGGGTSDTLIPAGEQYRSIYTADSAAIPVLSQYSLRSFNANLEDGRSVTYYVVSAESEDDVCAALDAAAVPYTPYAGDSGALDPEAAELLFILYLS